jgi:hypothetical protein
MSSRRVFFGTAANEEFVSCKKKSRCVFGLVLFSQCNAGFFKYRKLQIDIYLFKYIENAGWKSLIFGLTK